MINKEIKIAITNRSKFEKYMTGKVKSQNADGRDVFDLDLNSIVMEIDDILIQKGYEPFQRPLNACAAISDRIGISFTLGQDTNSFVKAVHSIYESLYRKSDLYMPPMHIGTFMFRDTFLPLRIPVVYGAPRIDFIECLHDVPDNIKKWIFHKDETAYTFYDQIIDLFDFVYGMDDVRKLKNHSEKAIDYWLLAKQQLEGASATLLGSIDKYTVIQNSIIAMELLLKGVLAANNFSDDEIKDYGHKMKKLVNKACEFMPKADHKRLKMVIGRTPKLIERRYEMKDYKRTELGSITMDAQFVAGEVLRQFAERDLRSSLKGENDSGRDYSKRYYPPLSDQK